MIQLLYKLLSKIITNVTLVPALGVRGLLFVLFFALQSFAQDNLNNYMKMAAKQNPEVKTAFNQYLAALEKVPQVGSLPDPQASFGFFLEPMQLLGGNQVANVELMQMFPWFGTLNASKSEATLMAKAKFEAFNYVKATIFYRVRVAWYQLLKSDKEIELVIENIELLESLEKMVLVKFQSPVSGNNGSTMPTTTTAMKTVSGTGMSNMNGGQSQSLAKPMTGSSSDGDMLTGMNNPKTGLQDVLRVKMEILEQKNRLAQLTDWRKTEEVGFNALLNRDVNSPVDIQQELTLEILPVDKLAIADSILKNNPMLAMLRNESESYTAMQQKAKKMGLPMIGLGLNYMVIAPRTGNAGMMNGDDMIMPMVSVSIPIYRKKYIAMQNEAKYLKEANKEQSVSLKNDLLVQYQQITQQIDNATRNVVLYKELENLARKTTELLLSDFSTTSSNYEEVLRIQMRVLDYGFKHIEAIVDNNTAIATIEMLMNSVKY